MTEAQLVSSIVCESGKYLLVITEVKDQCHGLMDVTLIQDIPKMLCFQVNNCFVTLKDSVIVFFFYIYIIFSSIGTIWP